MSRASSSCSSPSRIQVLHRGNRATTDSDTEKWHYSNVNRIQNHRRDKKTKYETKRARLKKSVRITALRAFGKDREWVKKNRSRLAFKLGAGT